MTDIGVEACVLRHGNRGEGVCAGCTVQAWADLSLLRVKRIFMCELLGLLVTSKPRVTAWWVPRLGFPGLSRCRSRPLLFKTVGRPAFLPHCGVETLPCCLCPAHGFPSHKDCCVGSVFLSSIVLWFLPQNSVPAFHIASLTTTGQSVRRNSGSCIPPL